MIRHSSLPLEVRLCLLYNRLFAFRKRMDSLIRERTESEVRRQQDPDGESRRCAEWEYAKAAALLSRFPPLQLAGRRVLDFGCRFGGASCWFAQQGAAHVVGVDIVPDMLKVAEEFASRKLLPSANGKHQHSRVEFRLGSAGHVPIDDQTVDLILSEDVVEHLIDPEAIFREWWRILVPGGQAVISFGPLWYHPHGVHLWEVFPGPWSHVLFTERTCVTVRNLVKGLTTSEQQWTDMNKMTYARFLSLVKASGFKQKFLRVQPLWGLKPLLLLGGLREFFVSEIRCILEK